MDHLPKGRLAVALTWVLIALVFATSPRLPAAAAPLADVAVGDPIALTFYLPLRNESGAEAAAAAIQTPGTAGYHHFMSVARFVSAFGPSNKDVATLESTLAGLGFTIEYVFPNHLAIEAVSTAANAERVFGTKLRRLTVRGRAGIAPTKPLQIPQQLIGLVRGVGGFNTTTVRRPHIATELLPRSRPRALAGALTGGTPENYLPADFEKFYNVNPITSRGITGRGSTIGIVTLATFRPADAYAFWRAIGLHVSPSRITKVNVDGGDVPGNNGGEDETDLDVEYSGAIAPESNIRVYIAPNVTNSNYVNAFEAAASENLADTISASWGESEIDFFTQFNLATTGTNSESFFLGVFHDAFLEMALQGQSVFIASGDSGAFDYVDECPFYGSPPTCNAPYTVDHPASDPLVTAAGGTTLPWSGTVLGVKISVPQERAWSWKYFSDQAAAQGLASSLPVSFVFAAGDGGGVSSYWPVPWYQLGTKHVSLTKPGQTLTQNAGSGSLLLQSLPANFAGRNLPDISANADPYSGYQFVYEGFVYNGSGGTSFVAPQLNGVDALFVQALGGRVGQISPAIFQLAGKASTDITAGDNWGYAGAGGYDNAAAGTLNAAKLLVGIFGLQYGPLSPAAVRAGLLYAPPSK